MQECLERLIAKIIQEVISIAALVALCFFETNIVAKNLKRGLYPYANRHLHYYVQEDTLPHA